MGHLESFSILFLAVLSLTLCAESRGYRFLPGKGKTLKVFLADRTNHRVTNV